ncbi:unnamed protein product [Periconia digitata]|uniref:Uncharacterized protein n=1 Tax=Periconia digitata TaxID=1303443 RepID=A0A9W4USV0_9PLEO|nr:unnamed protein product [Periconia digitata]
MSFAKQIYIYIYQLPSLASNKPFFSFLPSLFTRQQLFPFFLSLSKSSTLIYNTKKKGSCQPAVAAQSRFVF